MPFTISIGEPRGDAAIVSFTPHECPHLGTVARLIVAKPWSGCLWQGGYRAERNFIRSDLAVLDFDDGTWTIADAQAMLAHSDLGGLIGTTKSHQLAKKNQPACDRFRLVIPWQRPITDLRTYRQNMERLVEMLPVDKACKDGARFFFPCTAIVHSAWGGAIEWHPFQEPPRRKAPVYAPTDRMVPPWMEGELGNLREGERNRAVFRFAIQLKRRGWSQSDVAQLFAARVDLPRLEIEKTVASAWRYT